MATDDQSYTREGALLDLILGYTPMCPYLFQVPVDGAFGPQTCAGDCYEEPCTTSGPYPIFLFPDLVETIKDQWVTQFVEQRYPPDDHPAYEWLDRHQEHPR